MQKQTVDVVRSTPLECVQLEVEPDICTCHVSVDVASLFAGKERCLPSNVLITVSLAHDCASQPVPTQDRHGKSAPRDVRGALDERIANFSTEACAILISVSKEVIPISGLLSTTPSEYAAGHNGISSLGVLIPTRPFLDFFDTTTRPRPSIERTEFGILGGVSGCKNEQFRQVASCVEVKAWALAAQVRSCIDVRIVKFRAGAG